MEHQVTRVGIIGAFCALFLTGFQAGAHSEETHQGATAPAMNVTMLIPASNTRMNVAAVQNNRLQRELDWVFGGRTQRGWSLYVPLIEQLIAVTERVPFHSALAKWQESKKVAATGILDRPTWTQMIQTWQSRRIKKIAEPPADQLITAPAGEFFDPSRAEPLRRVERSTYAAYQRLLEAARADPSSGIQSDSRYFKIVSAHRSQAYQNQLRKASPNSGRAGLASRSPHLTGRALDLYVGGSPVSTADANRAIQIKSPAYLWMVKNAEKFGFYPYFYEPWHWEYRGS